MAILARGASRARGCGKGEREWETAGRATEGDSNIALFIGPTKSRIRQLSHGGEKGGGRATPGKVITGRAGEILRR